MIDSVYRASSNDSEIMSKMPPCGGVGDCTTAKYFSILLFLILKNEYSNIHPFLIKKQTTKMFRLPGVKVYSGKSENFCVEER